VRETPDFNPLSPHGERRVQDPYLNVYLYISIHSPRTGRDGRWQGNHSTNPLFQSTLPARGETAKKGQGA